MQRVRCGKPHLVQFNVRDVPKDRILKRNTDRKSQEIAQDTLSELPQEPKGWSPVQIVGFHKFLKKQKNHRQNWLPFLGAVQKLLNSEDFSSLKSTLQPFPILAFFSLCASPAQIVDMLRVQHIVPNAFSSILHFLGKELPLAKVVKLLKEYPFSAVQKFNACQKIVGNRWEAWSLRDEIFSIVSGLRFTSEEMKEIKQERWNQFLIDLFDLLTRKTHYLFLLSLNEFSLDQEGRAALLQKFRRKKLFEDQTMIDLRPLLPISEEEIHG